MPYVSWGGMLLQRVGQRRHTSLVTYDDHVSLRGPEVHTVCLNTPAGQKKKIGNSPADNQVLCHQELYRG